MDQADLPPKRDVARQLLLRGSVLVHLDPRRPEVDVPEWLADQAQLVLQIGFDLPIPIPDLRVTAEGVTGTLAFGDATHHCTVPWTAVFALLGEDAQGMLWPDDVPAEIAGELSREADRLRQRPNPGPPKDADVVLLDSVRPPATPKLVDLEATPAEVHALGAEPLEPTDAVPETAPTSGEDSRPKPVPRQRKTPLPPYLRVVK